MKDTAKQRLVGAIVLGSLAVIFVPIVLDGEGVSSPELGAIPEAPPLPPVPEIRPRRPVIAADTPAAEAPAPAESAAPPAAADESAAAAAASAEDEGPRLDERGLPAAWNVRLASFAEAGNAESLVARLLRTGYRGYSRPIESSQGLLTAVYVGPVLTRAEAEELQRQLQAEFKLEGLVVRFSIDEPDE